MTDFNNAPRMSTGGNGGPPGQELLSVSLSLLAAVLGTPYLFSLIGPVQRRSGVPRRCLGRRGFHKP